MNMFNGRNLLLGTLAGAAMVLAACNDDNSVSERFTYDVQVTNLTDNQPFSPPLELLHNASYQAWRVGSAASVGLEMLAEGGATAELAAEAEAAGATTVSAAAAVPPGGSQTVTVSVPADSDLRLTVATMLVNTNDAFTGVAGAVVGDLTSGGERVLQAGAYDAGTEANTETAATIPGPVAGGEGFNNARDDTSQVLMHGGVVTRSDGLADSALDESHRFDNPVARITITRR